MSEPQTITLTSDEWDIVQDALELSRLTSLEEAVKWKGRAREPHHRVAAVEAHALRQAIQEQRTSPARVAKEDQ